MTFAKKYYESLWAPFVISLAMFCVPRLIVRLLPAGSIHPELQLAVNSLPMLIYIPSLIVMCIIALWQLGDKKWRLAAVNLVLIPVSFLVISLFSECLDSLTPELLAKMFRPQQKIALDARDYESVIEGSVWGEQSEPPEDVYAFLSSALPDETQKSGPAVINNIIIPPVTGDNRLALVRHLATSCRWRLSRSEDGVLYAVRRYVKDGKWGYPEQWNVLIAPDGLPDFARTRTSAGVTASPAGSEPIELIFSDINRGKGPSLWFSHLSVNKENVFVEIKDGGLSPSYAFTEKMLRLVEKELSAVLQPSAESDENERAQSIPVFSRRAGDPILKVHRGSQQRLMGYYVVDAFVNPGARGYVFLKLFDDISDDPISFRGNGLEYVGWSENPREQFFYNASINIRIPPDTPVYPVRFELWFHPSDGITAERKLVERTYNVVPAA